VLSEVTAWQGRPLEAVYAVVFFDALRVKIREDNVVRNKAVYLALGVRRDGTLVRIEPLDDLYGDVRRFGRLGLRRDENRLLAVQVKFDCFSALYNPPHRGEGSHGFERSLMALD
jgi:hypothetical protein